MTRPGVLAALFALTVVCAAPLPPARADGPHKPADDKAQETADKKKKDKKNRDKKAATPAPAKVFTEEDLKEYSDDPEGKPRAKSAPAESAAAPEEDLPDSSQEQGGRQLWANRASDARDRIQDAQGTIAILETRIAALRDDVAPGRVLEPFRLQGIEADIAKAMQELEAARKELAAAQAAQEELQQEARRLGVPAGWLREP